MTGLAVPTGCLGVSFLPRLRQGWLWRTPIPKGFVIFTLGQWPAEILGETLVSIVDSFLVKTDLTTLSYIFPT